MKYSNEIIIDLPREKVIELMDNPENMKHWQSGLTGYKVLSEEQGKVGAQMELTYNNKGREMTMTETIVKNEFPAEFHAKYEMKGVYNLQQNFFQEIEAGKTKWLSHTEFQFKSIPLKIMAFFMPGTFKKQSYKFMVEFKRFAESEAPKKPS